MAFLLHLFLSNLQLEVFSSHLKLRLASYNHYSAVLDTGVLWATYHVSCFILILVHLWLSVGQAASCQSVSRFRLPFDGEPNCTHWHGDCLWSFPVGKTYILPFSCHFLEYSTVDQMVMRVWYHGVFQHCVYADRGLGAIKKSWNNTFKADITFTAAEQL